MPLYEYQCEACNARFEKIQKYSDPLVEVCPTCGGRVRKLLSSPAIQFKGSGWYITDYAKKSTSEASKAGSSSKDKDKSESTPASTSDAKPAAADTSSAKKD